MNPYFQIALDLAALMQTPQFKALQLHLQSTEGGAGLGVAGPGLEAAIRAAASQEAGVSGQPKTAAVPPSAGRPRGAKGANSLT